MRRRAGGMPVSTVLAAIVLLSAMTALTGCSAPAPTAEPVPLRVSVFQLRSDYASRGAQLEIVNPSELDLRVTKATFSSSWFSTTVSSPSAPTQLLAKSTTDFRVSLADPRCSTRKARPSVRVLYTRPDGSHGATTVVPAVPFDSLAVVHAQDCAQVDFQKVAEISFAPALRFDPPDAADGRRAALLDVTFTPTGAAGSVTVRSTEDTTLLAQREGTLRTLDLVLSAASAPVTVTLDYVPAGCLQHRVAEDKVGTLIPLRVDAGPYTNALFSVAVSPSLKAALTDWVGVYCGW